MNFDDGVASLHCPACERTVAFRDVTVTCPECDGVLDVRLDPDGLPDRSEAVGRQAPSGLDRFGPLVGMDPEAASSMDAGGSRPIECPSLAAEADVGTFLLADEGRNPTGTAVDREMAVAIAAAADRDVEGVMLPSTGHAAQSVAAYAGRAGLSSLAFVPSRTPFLNKAMANVHGGDLSVVEGRYTDALDAFEAAETDAFPVDARSPFRRLGAISLAWDLLAGLEWTSPDAIVLPVGHGHRIAALETGLRAALDADLITTMPRLYAAQPAGCAPIVTAAESESGLRPAPTPDSIIGPLEIPNPPLGHVALEAVENSDGGAVAVPDDDALAAAVAANATAGIECSATGGVGVAGASLLAEGDEIESEESVLVVDPLAVAAESDILRSHLMSQGI